MPFIKLPHFGQFDPASLEEYYDVTIDFNGNKIQIDLNFEGNSIEVERLEIVQHFIENIRIHDISNKKYLQSDYDDAGTVKVYLEHHLEELGEEELAALMKPATKPATYKNQLLQQLKLVRVGLYPDSKDQFAIFDYSIGQELTNYLVVIFTDENGNLDDITMEH